MLPLPSHGVLMLAATAYGGRAPASLDADSASPKRADEFRCRSVANPVLGHPISAVARVARITLKELILRRFLTVTGQFLSVKTLFSAVDSGIGDGFVIVGPGMKRADPACPGSALARPRTLPTRCQGQRVEAETPAPRGPTSSGLVSMLVDWPHHAAATCDRRESALEMTISEAARPRRR